VIRATALAALELRRRWHHARAAPGPLRDYLAVPFPRAGADCRTVRFVALDVEATGLDAASEELVSVGWVCVDGARIDLSTVGHRVIAVGREMPEASAVIHRITDDRAATGAPLREVLAEVLGVLAGKVLVAHNARSDLRYLDAACRQVFGRRLVAPAVDTVALAYHRLTAAGVRLRPRELRLDALRRRHNLPRYRAHDALSDAIACAELFLAELAHRDGAGVPLASLLL
jgi:DNA polymerase-3 subunit epsilon